MNALCTRCRYRFRAKQGLKEPCPYCGEKNMLVELEDAEKMVKCV